jgi:hypothetical protein
MNVLKDHVFKIDDNLGPETIVWKREDSKGIFRKQTTSIDILTNYRVLVYNAVVEYVAEQMALEVLNQNSQSASSFNMIMSGNRSLFRYGYGQSKSRGQTVVDGLIRVAYVDEHSRADHHEQNGWTYFNHKGSMEYGT